MWEKLSLILYSWIFVVTAQNAPKFIRPEEIRNLNCAAFIPQTIEDKLDLESNLREYAKNRTVYVDPKGNDSLKMDCESIFSRTYFQRDDLYPEEKEFPIAYVRVIFKDYMLVEKELATTYAPQNFYCFTIDKKSPQLFHSRVKALSNCLPNVFVTNRTFKLDSHGTNMGSAHHECILQLAKPEFKWKYLILLQNHELTLKTNQEMIQIFKWYNGTNDIKAVKVPPIKKLTKSGNWSFESLGLFKNLTRNTQPHNGYQPTLRFAKSTTHVSVSRAMIDFMLNDLNLTTLMHRIEKSGKVVDGRQMYKDELLMGTLNSDEAINAPGGFTHHCIDEGVATSGLTALVFWHNKKRACETNIMRHFICMLGMEHLKELTSSNYLFANKFLPSIDYGAISCWHERMHNRTHFDRGIHYLKPEPYLNMRQVRFNRERQELGDKFDASKFNCKK